MTQTVEQSRKLLAARTPLKVKLQVGVQGT